MGESRNMEERPTVEKPEEIADPNTAPTMSPPANPADSPKSVDSISSLEAIAETCSKHAGPNIPEQDPPLDVNDSDYDEDDGFDEADMDSGASATVRTSILEHDYEGGRRYHHYRQGRYPLPNDDSEQEREHLKHITHLEITGGKLFNSPIGENPQRIMDICTGTGLWAMDVAKMFPSAEVVGIDLSPIQPLMVPPNVRFLVDDVEDEWLDRGGYDFIHMRHSAIYLKDINKLMRNCYDHLRPGGWFEVTDYCSYIRCDDGTMPSDWPAAQCSMLMQESLLKYGMDSYIANYHSEKFKDAGFKDIQCRVNKIPIGPWPKDPTQRVIGVYLRDILHELISALSAKPLRNLGWSEAELEVFLASARKSLYDKQVHAYVNFISWWGQR